MSKNKVAFSFLLDIKWQTEKMLCPKMLDTFKSKKRAPSDTFKKYWPIYFDDWDIF